MENYFRRNYLNGRRESSLSSLIISATLGVFDTESFREERKDSASCVGAKQRKKNIRLEILETVNGGER